LTVSLSIPRKRRDDDDADGFAIPITPLVDIVFLLLVFFLVATTFMDEEKDLTLSLPRASAQPGEAPALERIMINIRSDGSLLLGNRPTSRESLFRALVEARRANPMVPVVLRGDKSASHGEIVGVLSICQRARIRNVAVAVQQATEASADATAEGERKAEP
jgi:biopolymer transport protein ExbD